MAPSAPGQPMPYRNESAYARFLDQDQYPCQKPPWGELSAVNANTGDVVWRVPLGGYDELETDEYKHGGTPNVGGSLATAGGLLFIAATNDSRFRAFDSRTGKELWVTKLDATGNAIPVSYQGKDGKQYVAIAAGGPDHLRNVGDTANNAADSLIAFALSDQAAAPAVTDTRTPPSTAPAPPAASVRGTLPDAKGKPVVMRICGECHGVETFSQSRMSRQEWSKTVDDMVERGASGTPEEIRTVVDYLAQYLGPAR